MTEGSAPRLIVTGATGALGSAAVARLAGGAKALGLDLRDRNAVRGAVRDAQFAVHCAAAISDDLELSRAVNVEGTKNLVDALTEVGCELLVHISTISVYDDSTGETTFDE